MSYENAFDRTIDEVSITHDLNWNDDSKIRLFARFLGDNTLNHDLAGWEKFLEVQANDEIVAASPKGEDERDPWGEDPDYPRADWRYQVANGDTNQGYWEWVEHEKEIHEDAGDD
jgi:hypothetical protein